MKIENKKETKMEHYDTDRMAEIVICLIKNFGTDGLIKYLLDRLIRNESDFIPPFYKTTKVVELEKEYKIPLVGVSRKQSDTPGKTGGLNGEPLKAVGLGTA
jgi:hypothetical protein